MGTKITMPVPVQGDVLTHFGFNEVTFKDGVAEVDFEVTDGLKSYLLSNGYGVGDEDLQAPDAPVEPADPRDHGQASNGTPLRDAAVDPRAGDFLPPTNAGDANPHGPDVVAPGLHGVAPGPIVPGTVGSPDYQETKETTTAEAVLSQGEDVGKVTAALNGIARAEYDNTSKKGVAKEADLGDIDQEKHYTPEERELLGLDDSDPIDPDLAPDDDPDEDPVVPDSETPAEELKGDALQQALKDADLALTGSADEKRARLAEHRAATVD